MTYCQLTSAERYMLAALRKQGLNQSQIAASLCRHRSTISRELSRNSSRSDGHYRPSKAQERTDGRRSRARRNLRFTTQDFARVDTLLCRQWSPEQARHCASGTTHISHETSIATSDRQNREDAPYSPAWGSQRRRSATKATIVAADCR